MKPIVKGSTVKYQDGYYRVSAMFRTTANLASIFGGKIYAKRVPLDQLVEAHDEWYERWSQSETYRCM